ncbi:hypothetical protein QAD02_005166 [Eretmocerus hayati]|uniref:Uncharacterized protein n=1 Tax=Eretmocerus hayati TaxID=131215 RepID=A0ACC2NS22_9HYME|nr:hypothetical protein QAD02_005166 [Eretmocerus hayati]
MRDATSRATAMRRVVAIQDTHLFDDERGAIHPRNIRHWEAYIQPQLHRRRKITAAQHCDQLVRLLRSFQNWRSRRNREELLCTRPDSGIAPLSASLAPAAAGVSNPRQHPCAVSNSQYGSDGQSAHSNGSRSSEVRAATSFRIETEVVFASSGSDSAQSKEMDLQAEMKSARDAFDMFEQTLDIDGCAQVISMFRSIRTRLAEQRYRDEKAQEAREQLEATTPEARGAAIGKLREKRCPAQ